MQTLQCARHKCENIHLQVQFPKGGADFAKRKMAPSLAALRPQRLQDRRQMLQRRQLSLILTITVTPVI